LRSWRLAIWDMLDAVEGVAVHVGTHDAATFQRDRTAVRAVERELAILGEAAKLVGVEVRERHPTVPWREMAALRDVLNHSYFGIDVALIWRIATEDLPVAATALRQLVDSEGLEDASDAPT